MKPPAPDNRLLLNLWLPCARVVVAIIFFLLGTFRTRGRYRVPREGGVIVLANHISDVDPIAIQYACPRHVRFMAKSELFDMKSIAWILRAFQAFPVKRGEPDREAIRMAADLAKAGKVVAIFPEGQLSEDGELQELKPGIALIVRMSKCPVICCGLKNLNLVMPYGSMIPRPAFRRLEATWGEAREFDSHATQEEIIAWATGQLRELTS